MRGIGKLPLGDGENPPIVHRGTVLREWIDYNGHFNLAYYMIAFDHGTDAFWDAFGARRPLSRPHRNFHLRARKPCHLPARTARRRSLPHHLRAARLRRQAHPPVPSDVPRHGELPRGNERAALHQRRRGTLAIDFLRCGHARDTQRDKAGPPAPGSAAGGRSNGNSAPLSPRYGETLSARRRQFTAPAPLPARLHPPS